LRGRNSTRENARKAGEYPFQWFAEIVAFPVGAVTFPPNGNPFKKQVPLNRKEEPWRK
jgi:hypothetical protein